MYKPEATNHVARNRLQRSIVPMFLLKLPLIILNSMHGYGVSMYGVRAGAWVTWSSKNHDVRSMKTCGWQTVGWGHGCDRLLMTSITPFVLTIIEHAFVAIAYPPQTWWDLNKNRECLCTRGKGGGGGINGINSWTSTYVSSCSY